MMKQLSALLSLKHADVAEEGFLYRQVSCETLLGIVTIAGALLFRTK
jgi:hypothetical protein